MNKEIIIFDEEGGKLISLQEMKRISIEEFVERVQVRKISTPILPHVIWYEDTGLDKCYAIEVPPRKRVISYFDSYYECGFPFLVFIIRMSGKFIVNVGMAMSTSDIDDFEDMLFRCPLPNADDRALLCLGLKFDTEIAQIKEPIKQVKYVIPFFEASKYNDHLMPLAEWVPEEIRGDYQGKQGTDAVAAFHNVLKRWQDLTAAEDWIQVVLGKKKDKRITWVPFKSFRNFSREST